MDERELLRQMVQRNINNMLNSINPGLRMFSGSLTNYAMEFLEPYISGFTNPSTQHINTKAATAFLKDETNKKIEEFMKKFENEIGNDHL
jgi:predicted component of type VI protein secretion system